MIVQPNILYSHRDFWDFFDNYIPQNNRSLIETLQVMGFKVNQALPTFLPYIINSRKPQNPLLVKIYLKMPFTWKILGKQILIIDGMYV